MRVKDELFALELFKGLSQRKAYRIAFPHAVKWKDETVDSKASTLANTDKVKARLAELRDKQEKRVGITSDMVIKELGKIAFIQESDFYHDNGDVKKLSELTDEQRAGLASYGFKSLHVGEGEYIDVPIFKAQDKTKALELLGKHFGIFTDKVEHSGEIIKRTINVNPTKKSNES